MFGDKVLVKIMYLLCKLGMSVTYNPDNYTLRYVVYNIYYATQTSVIYYWSHT